MLLAVRVKSQGKYKHPNDWIFKQLEIFSHGLKVAKERLNLGEFVEEMHRRVLVEDMCL